MNRTLITLGILLLVLLMSSPARADRCFWWTIGSGGDIRDGRSVGGVTLGQTAIGPVTESDGDSIGNYGFWNNFFDSLDICFTLSEDSWPLDTLRLSETVSMADSEYILVSNCGNCHLSFGLEFTGDILGWSSGSWADINRFGLYARFNEDGACPAIFDSPLDFVKNLITWASPEIFGPSGNDLGIDDSYFLWFKFCSPTRSDTYGDNTIVVEITAKSYLP